MALASSSSCLVSASLIASTVPDMLARMQAAASAGADVVELRLDKLVNFIPSRDLPTLLRARTLPSIVTYRPKWGGGDFEGNDDVRLDVLELAVNLGANFVEVELQVAADFFARLEHVRSKSCRIIVSSHNYGIPLSVEDIGNKVVEIQSTSADIIKIVTVAHRITDVAAAFQILSYSQVPTIVTVTGACGLIGQLLCPKFGGYLTVGSLDLDLELDSGKPKLLDLTNVYKIHRVNRETKVFGVVSNPVGHSKGPILHNAAFVEVGFDAIYVPFLVEDDLEEFLKVYSSCDFAGFSVGLPHKEAAVNCCDYVDPLAKEIGAVNTIIRRQDDGKLMGYNTDCWASISAIEDKLAGHRFNGGTSPLSGRVFVVVGAGGAGRALAFGAKIKGAHVIIANRDYERAKALADAVGGDALPLEALNGFSCNPGMILANASTVGMLPDVHEMPVSKKCLTGCSLVFDAVYTPAVTRLIREAEELGIAVVGGLEMFVRQAVAQFELFTGHQAPVQMKTQIRTLLGATV